MVEYTASFFEEDDGESPVEEFLNKEIPRKSKEKIIKFIGVLEEKGTTMPIKWCKKLTHSKLWELIVDLGTNGYRIFFVYDDKHGEKNIILLHGIVKKTDETPPEDIEMAEKRMLKHFARKGRKF